MITANDVGWGKYLQYEGPYWKGSARFTLPDSPTDNDKFIDVITATEGGKLDAINAYDRMIISAGAIQWGEAGQYSVSDLLGKVGDTDASLLDPLQPALDMASATFQRNDKGRHRFFMAGSEVDTTLEQKQLFLHHSNGTIGSWDDESKTWAKTWAACVANVLAQPGAQKPQVDFTSSRLVSYFVIASARGALWGSGDPTTNSGWVGALRGAYLSFAANLPAVAGAHLATALSQITAPKWSQDWAIEILKELTFGPNIAIYPHRYDAIRPVIETLFGVDMPDFAAELKAWNEANNVDPTCGPGTPPTFTSTKEVQTELLAEGYDLGPAGADGSYGEKTHAAVQAFQQANGLNPDGIVGKDTRAALLAKWESRSTAC